MAEPFGGIGQTCPVQPYRQKTSTFAPPFLVPKFFPSGTYSGYFTLTDQNNNVIQSIQFDMPIS